MKHSLRSFMIVSIRVHFRHYHQNERHSNWSIDGGFPEDIGKNTYPRRALLAGADNSLEIFLMQESHDIDIYVPEIHKVTELCFIHLIPSLS
ncbi:hypothetical protein JTB14_037317 [Gonioctena quinquepunctata]|nr:hypothetical protein JTB14_037317 [Gonioctena quinquepunctata]